MNLLRLIPVLLSFGLLAAHFSRTNLFPLVILSLAIPLLLFIKKAWAARSIQFLLLLGAAEWIRAMFGYIGARKAIGDDWGRLAIILGAVALLTALSGLVFRGSHLKQRYRLDRNRT
jgi:hypothetical protein